MWSVFLLYQGGTPLVMLALMLLVMLAVISVGLNKVLFDSNKHLFRTQQTKQRKKWLKK